MSKSGCVKSALCFLLCILLFLAILFYCAKLIEMDAKKCDVDGTTLSINPKILSAWFKSHFSSTDTWHDKENVTENPGTHSSPTPMKIDIITTTPYHDKGETVGTEEPWKISTKSEIITTTTHDQGESVSTDGPLKISTKSDIITTTTHDQGESVATEEPMKISTKSEIITTTTHDQGESVSTEGPMKISTKSDISTTTTHDQGESVGTEEPIEINTGHGIITTTTTHDQGESVGTEEPVKVSTEDAKDATTTTEIPVISSTPKVPNEQRQDGVIVDTKPMKIGKKDGDDLLEVEEEITVKRANSRKV